MAPERGGHRQAEQRCPEGRCTDGTLTEQGLAAIEAAAPGHAAAVWQALIDRITPQGLATFTRASAAIIDGLRELDQN
jgi:hypothetical protein